MGRIIFARHGESVDGANRVLCGTRDSPLTARGVCQAYDSVTRLRISSERFRIKHVISSQLKRQWHTAQICASGFGVLHSILDCLVERHHGILEGCSYDDIPRLAIKCHKVNGHFFVIEAQEAEGYAELCERAKQSLATLRQAVADLHLRSGDDVLVIGSSAIGRAMFIVNEGKSHEQIFDLPPFDNCEFRVLE
jgi:broad specificity phosphatase PhoE